MSTTPPQPAQPHLPPHPAGDHPEGTTRAGLRPGRLGVGAIVFFVVAAVAPMAAIVGASPIVFSANGVAAPATYLLAALLFVVFSVGYVAMSRHITNAGGFVAYNAQGFGARVATAAAGLAILTYTALQAALWSQFSVFAHDLAAGKLGLDLPSPLWMFAEPSWIEWRPRSGHLEDRGGGGALFTVARLVLDRRQVVDRRMQPVRIEPTDPLGGLPLHLVPPGPQSVPVDQLGLVEPYGRLHHRVVEGLTG